MKIKSGKYRRRGILLEKIRVCGSRRGRDRGRGRVSFYFYYCVVFILFYDARRRRYTHVAKFIECLKRYIPPSSGRVQGARFRARRVWLWYVDTS